jgi:hypothetical protein
MRTFVVVFAFTVAGLACGEACPADRELAVDAYASLRECSDDSDCVSVGHCACASGTNFEVAVAQDHVERMERRWDRCCRAVYALYCPDEGSATCVDGLCALEEDGTWYDTYP